MNSSVRLAWIMLGVSALFAIAGAYSLIAFSLMSLVSLPGLEAAFAKSITNAQDIAVIKKACLALTSIEEGERITRLHFVGWGLGLVVLLGAACAALSARLLFILNQANDAAKSEKAMEIKSPMAMFFSQAQDGTLKLWQAFWLLYLPAPAILYAVFGVTFTALKSAGKLQDSFLLQFIAFPLSLSLAYLVFIAASIVVWRCSENTGHRVWSYCARILVILSFAVPLLKLAIILLPIWTRG